MVAAAVAGLLGVTALTLAPGALAAPNPKLEQVQEETGLGFVGYLVDKDGYCSTEISVGDAYGELDPQTRDAGFDRLRQAFS